MKRIAAFALILVMCVMLAACSGGSNSSSGTTYTNKYGTPTTKCAYPGCSNKIASSGDTNCCVTHSNKCLNCRKYIDGDAMYCMSCLTSAATGSGASSTSSFTNKYGTPTTKCAYPGCSNKIASSGDTNCCVTHSNKCLNCRKYIDGDAMYCMSCLTSAASKKSSNSVSGSSGKSAKNKCSYKQGGKEVCSSPRASGSNFCSYHTQYLNDAYDSLFGH